MRNESYLGQTEANFRNTPFKRLAASRFDKIDTEHFRSYVRHFIELDSDTNLITTAYATTFQKLDKNYTNAVRRVWLSVGVWRIPLMAERPYWMGVGTVCGD